MSAPLSSPRVRALSAALREACDTRGVGVRQLARDLGVPHSRVSQVLAGKRVPSVEFTVAILSKLGVVGDEYQRIVEQARNVGDPNMLIGGQPGMSSGLAGILDCERTAEEIIVWNLSMFPGLLQRPRYAAVTIADDGPVTSQVEALVRTRMGRREILMSPSPVVFRAFIGEFALTNEITSRPDHLDQLRHVQEMVERRNIVVSIIPDNSGYHPGLVGPFIIYHFPDAPPIVHIEHYSSTAWLYEEKEVNPFLGAVKRLEELGKDPKEAVGIIASVITKLEKTL